MIYLNSETFGKMIRFGKMIPTHTIIYDDYVETAPFDLLGEVLVHEQGITWQVPLSEDAVVYGLGESLRGMNKRGYVYKSFCTDDHMHSPDKESLYGAHNFLLIHDIHSTGIYLDFAGKITYDVDFGKPGYLVIDIEGKDLDIYLLDGSYKEIVTRFRRLIGPSYIPPKWGFGYQQSRWSYESASVVKEIADKFDENDIPCDAIYLDIDYMENFKDFTVDDQAFPNFDSFVEAMKARGFHLVPIIDAGVKIEKGYDVYEEGVGADYFTVDENGSPFVAAVWPGRVHFPDFFNPEVRSWFGQKYHRLMDSGIEGFWNDMNEPAIFYSENGINAAIDFVEKQKNVNLDIYTFFELKDKISRISNSLDDYKSMYHRYENGLVNHYDVHNLYGYFMTQSAAEGFKTYDSQKRYLLITRASHIGMAKYSGIWTGDNHSWWEHLKLNIQMMPGLNMSGFVYSGADTGGFGGNASADLLLRWHQFSLFTPLLRNHSAMGTRQQEPWAFDQKTLDHLRNVIRLRYAMVPFLYSEFMKSIVNYSLLFAPLAYDYKDDICKRTEDQLLFGSSLMLAPVYEQNSLGRTVYCPEKMLLWKAETFESIQESQLELIDSGHHYVSVGMNQIPIYIRKNQMIPLVSPENRVEKLSLKRVKVIAYVESQVDYELYEEIGHENNHQMPQSKRTLFRIGKADGHYEISVDTNDASLEEVTFYLIDDNGQVTIIVQQLNSVERQFV